jgi:GTPase SAR1 family protein
LEKNKRKTKLKGKDILGKKVLILGESGSGKTKLTAKLLQELTKLTKPEKMTAIDLAPQRTENIGGKLANYVDLTSEVKYLSPEKVYTPRLAGTSPKEVLRYAELNRKIMEPLLDDFIKNPTEALIINDITLYLHNGELEKVLTCLRLTKTFLATAYYGSKLAEDLGTGISARERRLTDKLAIFMDLVVKID